MRRINQPSERVHRRTKRTGTRSTHAVSSTRQSLLYLYTPSNTAVSHAAHPVPTIDRTRSVAVSDPENWMAILIWGESSKHGRRTQARSYSYHTGREYRETWLACVPPSIR
jgi:hypothetical protein